MIFDSEDIVLVYLIRRSDDLKSCLCRNRIMWSFRQLLSKAAGLQAFNVSPALSCGRVPGVFTKIVAEMLLQLLLKVPWKNKKHFIHKNMWNYGKAVQKSGHPCHGILSERGDYGISQFRFLQYILLVHGRWCYRRPLLSHGIWESCCIHRDIW